MSKNNASILAREKTVSENSNNNTENTVSENSNNNTENTVSENSNNNTENTVSENSNNNTENTVSENTNKSYSDASLLARMETEIDYNIASISAHDSEGYTTITTSKGIERPEYTFELASGESLIINDDELINALVKTKALYQLRESVTLKFAHQLKLIADNKQWLETLGAKTQGEIGNILFGYSVSTTNLYIKVAKLFLDDNGLLVEPLRRYNLKYSQLQELIPLVKEIEVEQSTDTQLIPSVYDYTQITDLFADNVISMKSNAKAIRKAIKNLKNTIEEPKEQEQKESKEQEQKESKEQEQKESKEQEQKESKEQEQKESKGQEQKESKEQSDKYETDAFRRLKVITDKHDSLEVLTAIHSFATIDCKTEIKPLLTEIAKICYDTINQML